MMNWSSSKRGKCPSIIKQIREMRVLLRGLCVLGRVNYVWVKCSVDVGDGGRDNRIYGQKLKALLEWISI